MIDKVRAFIHRHQLLSEGAAVIVGVSGGPDSLALLHVFLSLRDEWKLQVIAAHVDHMFRGRESEEEMEFVKRFCVERRILCETAQIDVPAFQRRTGLGAQEAARICRYRFFAELMEKHQAGYVAVGHHGDDQVETILMRLVRGSTSKGYAGIPVKRPFHGGYLIRPFLAVSRAEIEAYCQQMGLSPRRDPSNEKDDYTRNRFRHHIVPLLRQENPRLHERFQQYSEMMAEDEQFLEELAADALNKVMEKQHRDAALSIGPFLALPRPLQRRVLQRLLLRLYGGVPPTLTSVHIGHILMLCERGRPSGMIDLPKGLKVIRSYDRCLFTFGAESGEKGYWFELPVPALLPLPNGYAIISEFGEHYPRKQAGNDWFVVDPASVSLPLRVRTRRRGDRMVLKGTGGTKKLKEIFIEAKIPRMERDRWPIVEDADGRILWVPGLKKSALEAQNRGQARYILLHYQAMNS
ncbi:tRNA(Ile)-lysidine synthetase [Geobacillus proteiniphilus]|uniref:tRNA(Ile)-lysidine synthase n=1 Tax=Geobacillus proteiniphilus TaxID=860353 RepID=A0A1Q5SZQ4_9BACL|nr:tRNA lysidine(34) synthetase TilS [Geobacillus proteiniphilus]OKO93473.1 tRNA(Ile)-lysidine synthetase [Geobacillus proteiniphilus]